MPGLIKILRWYFGIEALLLFISPALAVWSHPPDSLLHPRAFSLDQQVRVMLTLASFGALLLILTAVFAMAWWSLPKGKTSSRTWAIAASLLNVPLVFVARPMWLSTAAGIAGLWVFSRRQTFVHTAPTIPRPRDGTSSIVDMAAQVAMCGGALVIWSWWLGWAQMRNLPIADELPLLLQLIFASLVSTTLHELGHVLAGWSVGMKLQAFVAGPFHWRMRDSRWTFEFHPTGLLLSTGAAGLVESRPEYRRRSGIAVAAAGPLASLLVGSAALFGALNAEGQPWASAWELLALITTCSLLTFAINLIPMRPECGYSDGARIYQLLFRSS